jgi:hypothetical protein
MQESTENNKIVKYPSRKNVLTARRKIVNTTDKVTIKSLFQSFIDAVKEKHL